MPRKPASTAVALRHAETQVRVARALTLMRERHSATAAAQAVGTTLRTMRRHAGRALRQTPSGRYAVASGDRLLRRLRMLNDLCPRGCSSCGQEPHDTFEAEPNRRRDTRRGASRRKRPSRCS